MRSVGNCAAVRHPSITMVSCKLSIQALVVGMRHTCCGFSGVGCHTESEAMTSTFGLSIL